MPPDPSHQRVSISPEHLRVERFVETRKVESFDCGNSDLNDFLCTEEVSEYEAEGLGRTYLVYYQGDLVGYFTVTNDSLRVEYLKTVKSFSKFAEKSLEALPALKIGRLAVAREHQRKGFGRLIIKYIAGMAVQLGASTGIRLLVLQAKPESIDFYEKKCGFELTRETKRERGRRNRTMFLDLYAIADVAHRR